MREWEGINSVKYKGVKKEKKSVKSPGETFTASSWQSHVTVPWLIHCVQLITPYLSRGKWVHNTPACFLKNYCKWKNAEENQNKAKQAKRKSNKRNTRRSAYQIFHAQRRESFTMTGSMGVEVLSTSRDQEQRSGVANSSPTVAFSSWEDTLRVHYKNSDHSLSLLPIR